LNGYFVVIVGILVIFILIIAYLEIGSWIKSKKKNKKGKE